MVAVLVLTTSACEPRAPPDPRTDPPLVLVTRVAESGTKGSALTGVIRARVESALGFLVAGRVVARLVESGQQVRRGQILMRLDAADLALSTAAQTAAVAGARAKAAAAASELSRLDGLVASGAISAKTYDLAKAQAEGAAAELAATLAGRGAAASAEDHAVLRADADGLIETISADPGQVIALGQPVIVLAHEGPREAAVSLPETTTLKPGANATATIYGRPEALPAMLRQRSAVADPLTRTFDARFVLQCPESIAPLGATVTLAFQPLAGANTTDVPLGALYDPGQGPGVWLLVGDRVHFRSVRLVSLGTETAQIAGLASGSEIVAAGADRLREGEHVRRAPSQGDASPP